MIIAMTLSMSGGRYDDRQWLGPGVPFEVPDWEGKALVADHNAVDLTGKVSRDDLGPHQRLPGGPPHQAPAPVSLPAETAAGPVTPDPPPGPGPEPVPEPDPREEAHSHLTADGIDRDPPEPPSQSDPKPAWVAWAVSQGEDETVASAMTKADLMSKHGGRL